MVSSFFKCWLYFCVVTRLQLHLFCYSSQAGPLVGKAGFLQQSNDLAGKSSPNDLYELSGTINPTITYLRHWDVVKSVFYLWTFFLRTVIAAKRRSGAPSKVYQWLGPRCRYKMTLKHFANHSPNFTGVKSAKFGLDSQNQSPLKSSSFETEQYIANLKHVSGA